MKHLTPTWSWRFSLCVQLILLCTCAPSRFPNRPNNTSEVIFPGITSFSNISGVAAQLNWTESPYAENYLVFQIVNRIPTLITVLTAPASSYAISGLTAGGTYTYRVNLIDSAGRIDGNEKNLSFTTTGYQNFYSTNFNGTSAFVAFPSLQMMMATAVVTKFSLSFWVKSLRTPLQYDAVLGAVSSTAWSDGIGFYWNSSSQMGFFVNNYAYLAKASVPAFGQWNHVVGVFDNSLGGNNIQVYVNGIAGTGVTQTNPVSIPSSALRVGNMPAGGYFDGHIDEIATWNTTLSPAAIAALYNSGHPNDVRINHGGYNQSANLSSFWQMGDSDTYPTIADKFSSFDGTMNGMSGADFVRDTP